ncbi:MAG: ribosome maturation factor RimP [Myxococcota bacterium]
MYRDIPPELREIVEPVLADHGCELVDVDLRLGHGQGLVRVVVDSDAGDGLVQVDRCAVISREIESALDAADAIPGRYRLEVSSPGLDRWLGREKDFEAAVGCEVKIEARRPLEGRRRFRGLLEGFQDGEAKVKLDGPEARVVSIPFDEVKKANTVYKFSRQDFSGRASD